MATYSAPPGSGVLYRTHSPRRTTTACPAATSSTPWRCSTAQETTEHQRVLVEIRSLPRLDPPLGTSHVSHAEIVLAVC